MPSCSQASSSTVAEEMKPPGVLRWPRMVLPASDSTSPPRCDSRVFTAPVNPSGRTMTNETFCPSVTVRDAACTVLLLAVMLTTGRPGGGTITTGMRVAR